MQEKEYDLFMNMLRNPDASFDTFVAGGLTTDNTQLLGRSEYESSEKVQEALKDQYGQFDKNQFDQLYNNAQMYYNLLSSANYDKAMQEQVTYHRDDIFAPADQRRTGPDYQQVIVSNPYKQTSSVFELGKVGERTKSVDELAQANKVLLNPSTAGDNLENAQWGDSPNDSFAEHFFDTLVLAQYDEDGTHTDLVSGQIVEHKKGDLKLDQNGNFYYEKLDGRDIYGRRVLNKMNVLTTDGSFWNRYDFFDSDDINQKSVGGSILKNLALVGTMFIPYVGPWIAGLSIATQLAGLGATLGKMIAGSDNPTLSEIEGWSKSVSRQGAQTEYAQENTWCWENFINLIGDVAGQLKEQRFVFEKIPYALSGTNIYSKESMAAKLAELQKGQQKLFETRVGDLSKLGKTKEGLQLSVDELRTMSTLKAQAELDSFMKGYQKLGEVMSKGYMTAITVGDTYGEAKQAGASDLDATLLTLGYAAGEYALLNTGLGEWILPELRAGRYKSQAIAKALANINQDTQALYRQFGTTLKNVPKEGKKQYVKKIFNLGRDIARAEYATGSRALTASLAAGAGEGVEEVSEELLADFSKGCYDVVKWLQGEDTRLDSFGYNFDTGEFNVSDLANRYSMSLVGGFIGGGLTNAGTNYQSINNLGNMTSKQAIEEVVYMARNGGLNKFLKEVNKMQLGDRNLSMNTQRNEDGTISFVQGTEQDNQDVYIKRAINQQARLIEQILQANGASLSDESFLDTQTLNDLRFTALHNSSMAGELLNEFNGLSSDIVKLTSQINTIQSKALDANGDKAVSDKEKRNNELSDDDKAVIKKLESQLKDKQKQLQELLEGKRSYEFIADALFEMTPALSGNLTTVTFPLFAEQMYGKKFSELTNDEKATAQDKYTKWKASEGREHIKEISTAFRNISYQVSNLIKQSAEEYQATSDVLQSFNKLLASKYVLPEGSEVMALKYAQNEIGEKAISEYFVEAYKTEESDKQLRATIQKLADIDQTLPKDEIEKQEKQIQKEVEDIKTDILLYNIDHIMEPYLGLSFANKQVKSYLLQLLNRVKLANATKIWEWQDWAESQGIWNEENPYERKNNDIISYIKYISNLNDTPLEENLNQFSISIGNDPISISGLQERLNDALTDASQDVTRFNIEDSLYTDLENAIDTMRMYRAAILAARTDQARVGDLYGYNAVLNEISGSVEGQSYPELAEIDSQTADIFVADIDANLNKLIFLKKLYNINRSQKLSRQNRIATKKDLLIYKRLKSIVQVLDDDELNKWEGFLQLQTAINGMTLHEDLLRSNSTNLSEEQREQFEKETIQAEDAIYDFFQIESNKAKLSDPKQLAQLINPNKLQLYTEGKELLNEGLDNLDDNSIVWWLASRSAIRSTDFYNQYRQTIDPKAEHPLAPISTQELAIYNNYASIVNGNIFSNFYKAYRQAIVEDWKSKTVDQRREIAKRINIDEVLLSDDMADYALNFLPAPRYQNIILTEGIPGSGKSTAVYSTTIKLLQQTHPDLLKNVAVVHGANADSAIKLRDDVGLKQDNSKTYGREGFMKEINPEWKEYQLDPVKRKYLVPRKDYAITDEKEIRSSLGIKETQTPPSLIVIDEISKFTAYDLDQIDRFAKKYGITVLVAGDFDQSGIVGTHSIEINGKNLQWNVDLIRTNFIRSPKLGVSMRTDNSIKTANLQKLQAYMQDPTNEKIVFQYYEDETGLYGDKVLLYNATIGRNEDKEVTSIETDKQATVQVALEEIDKLINTLKPGQKIGYIYSDRNSPIFTELSSDKYSKYIDFREGGSAQGLEGQYYVIEADFDNNTTNYLKDVYTGMSRAQQGSIIIAPSGEDKGIINFDSEQVHEKIDEPLSNATIAKFANDKKQLLDKIAASGNKIEYTPRTSESVVTQTTQTTGNGLQAGTNPTPPPTTLTYEQEKKELLAAIEDAEDAVEADRFIFEANLRHPGLREDQDVIAAYNRKEKEEDELPVIPFEAIPESLRENAVKAIQAAKSNPRTDSGLDQNDNNSDLKYGDVVRISDDEYVVIVGVKVRENGNHSYETLRISSPRNNTWGFESWPYFRTQITGIVKQPQVPSQSEGQINPSTDKQPEALIYEEDSSPITQTDIIEESAYQEAVDTSNQEVNLPQSTTDDTQASIAINMLLHTFNTFETGVLVGPNGEPVPVGSQAWMNARIDSINGLIKIDQLLGRPVRTVQEYVRQIGRLRSILFNTQDKSDICTRLQNNLGLSGVYCTFALKSSPRPGDKNKLNGREFVDSNPTPFSKGISEQTMFNGSSDTKSHEWHPKSIVAIIGSKDTGDVLELPLIALSSPFTLLQIKDNNGANVFDQVFNRFQTLKNNGMTYHEISETLIREFDGNVKYQNLINLFKLFNFTDGGVFYIRDPQWTPAKNLELLGPQFVTNRGYYQGLPGLGYDNDATPESEWLTVNDFANNPDRHNPQTYVTKNVMVSISGMVDAGDKSVQIVNPGHPFVLVSYDTDLNSDKKVVDYYIRQATDPSVPKKVKLVYVIPPKATIREYLDNLHKILNKEPNVQNIGQLFTSYKLLKILINNDSFRSELERKAPGLLSKVERAIQEVDALSTIDQKKDKLYETQDWSQEGFSAKPVKLAGLFDGVLMSFAYNRNTLNSLIGEQNTSSPDDVSIQLMEAILSQEGIDGIYYNVKVPKDNPTMIGSFTVPLQGNNYSISGKPFRIHGKIDSYTFRGNMDWLVSYALSKMNPTKNGHLQSGDSYKYRDRNSNLVQTISPQQRAINNTLKYLQQKTGRDFSEFYQDGNIQEGNARVVDTLLSDDNGLIAFTIGNSIKVSNRSDYLKGVVVIQDSSGNSSTSLDAIGTTDNNGNYQFTLTTLNGAEMQVYNATYDSKNDTLIITPEVETKNSNITLSVTPENVTDYLNEGREILESIFDFDPTLSDAFQKTTYEEFIQALNDLEYIGDMRIDDLQSLLEDATPEQKQIINDLIELERSHDPDKQDVNDEGQVCPPNFKILF